MHIWLWTHTESTSDLFRSTGAQRDIAGSKVEKTPCDRIHDIVNMDYDGTRNGRVLEIGITAWTLQHLNSHVDATMHALWVRTML